MCEYMQYKLPQSKPDGFASSLGEGAFGSAESFAVLPKAPSQRTTSPGRGKMSRSDKKGNLSSSAAR